MKQSQALGKAETTMNALLAQHLGCTFLFLTRTIERRETMEWKHRIFPAAGGEESEQLA
jgi:hypothetical protein